MSIFKACDIRGVYGQQWGPDDAFRIGAGLGRMMAARGDSRICVGGDFRASTPEIKQSLSDGLIQQGAALIDVGQLPTPAIYAAASQLNCASVAIVTASHNPGGYNGVKFMVAGQPAVPAVVDQLQAAMSQSSAPHSQGTSQQHDFREHYEHWIVGHARNLRFTLPTSMATDEKTGPVIVDAMGGTYTHIGPRVLTAAGYDVSTIGGPIDPEFSGRTPNPASDDHLRSLVEHVRQSDAAVGIAWDGDGDRVIFIDELGQFVRPEQVAALLLRPCFQEPTVVFDLKCASLVRRSVISAGGTPVMQPSGHGFIKAAMIERNADLGVEVSGHHFFAALQGGDDGLFTALVVLGVMRRTGKLLHELIAPFVWPVITPDLRIPFDGDAAAAMEQIASTCGGQVSRLDGVRAEYDNGWALARASITEPAITLRFEGTDQRQLVAIARDFLAGAGKIACQVLELIDE